MATPPPSDLKTCPSCAEEVRAAAARCRFCGYDFFVPLPANMPSAEEPVTPAEVMDLLQLLVDRSLVVFDDDTGRFRFLDSVRDYARSRLCDAGEDSQIDNAHAAYYARLATDCQPKLQNTEVKDALRVLSLEEANVRAALNWCLTTPAGILPALQICRAFALYWHIRGQFREGRSRCAAALDHSAPNRDPAILQLKVAVLSAAGNLAFAFGDYPMAVRYQSLALPIRERLGDDDGLAITLHNLAIAMAAIGEREASLKMEERALELNRRLGNRVREASNLNSLAMLAAQQGDHQNARRLYEETIEIARADGDRWTLANVLHNLSELLIHHGDSEEGRVLLIACLQECRDLEYWPSAAVACELLAALEAAEGRLDFSALAMSVADSIRGEIGLPRTEAEARSMEQVHLRLREAGEDAREHFGEPWTGGMAAGLRRIIQAAATGHAQDAGAHAQK